MSAPDVVWKDGKFGRTSRRDSWWLSPTAIFLGLGAFLVYANWAAFQNAHYTYGPYISPFYSPELFGSSPHALFAAWWEEPSREPCTKTISIICARAWRST